MNGTVFGQIDDRPTGPSRLLYVLSGLMLVAGVSTAVWSAKLMIQGFTEMAPQRVALPGTVEIDLPGPGKHVIFHEYRSDFGGKAYANDPALQDLVLVLVDPSTGKPVALATLGHSETYQYGGRKGAAAFAFEIDRAGAYKLSASYPQDRTGPEVVLAIGRGFPTRAFVRFLIALFAGIACCAGGVVIAVVTGIKRNRARSAPRMPLPASGPPPPPTG